jgi:hypothetical protein
MFLSCDSQPGPAPVGELPSETEDAAAVDPNSGSAMYAKEKGVA